MATLDEFLGLACLDWRTGGPDRDRAAHAAARLLARHPEFDLASLAAAPPNQPTGPRHWPPLLYLCSLRLAGANPDALAIARALLDRGADPNAFYPGGNASIHYSALTCVIGRGEERAPLHPQALDLARLLLERGAEPFDTQVLYNLYGGHASQPHLGAEAVWLLDLIHSHSPSQAWTDPDWPHLAMGAYGCGARYLLNSAISANHVPLAAWLLDHGANPNAPPASDPRLYAGSLYAGAVRRGRHAIAALLASHGANTSLEALTPEELLTAAALSHDRQETARLLDRHPGLRHSPAALEASAELDDAEAARLLLDLGVTPAPEHLHTAAYHGATKVTALLIGCGVDPNAVHPTWDATPIGAAFWGGQPATVALLAPVSRDVFALTSAGCLDRLRELLEAEPNLARATWENQSPLFWLPDDEPTAAAIVTLFLTHAADPTITNATGQSAAALARLRHLDAPARLLSGAP